MSVSKSSISKSIACGVSTIALSLGLASPGLANPLLPGLTNLNFTQANGGGTISPKCGFTSCNLAGWTGGNGLIYVDGQAPGTTATTGAGIRPTSVPPAALPLPQTMFRPTAILRMRVASKFRFPG